MKQIIPFKKELMFKTKVSEITSISLEHEISSKNNGVLKGNFVISGDYKMTEGSINREEFKFDIPFEIALSDSYVLDSIVMDIDNFYYELIDSEILKVNIDVYVSGDEKEDREEVVIDNSEEEIIDDVKYEDTLKVDSLDDADSGIFNTSTSDTYVTYYVYVVKEDDTIDKLISRFNVTKEELEEYNDLSSFREKMKLIIPSRNE